MSASRGLLNRAITRFRVTYSGLQFCGPAYEATSQRWRGHNSLNATCRQHDIAYSRSNDLTDRHAADKVFANKALGRDSARDSVLSERTAAAAIWITMKAKTKIGMKPKKKTTRKKVMKKWIFPTMKRGGALPFLPMLGALGSLSAERSAWRKR